MPSQCVQYVCIWLGLPHFPWIVNKLCVQYSIFSLPPREGSDCRTKRPGMSHALRPLRRGAAKSPGKDGPLRDT